MLSFYNYFFERTSFLGAFSLSSISPFWVDFDPYGEGNVFYRFTSEQTILNAFTDIAMSAFGNDFIPPVAFIATWDQVYPRERSPLYNAGVSFFTIKS